MDAATLTLPKLFNQTQAYQQLKTHYDSQYKTVWYTMCSKPRPCFTQILLNDLNNFLDSLSNNFEDSNSQEINYTVVCSDTPGVFNLGGDLNFFKQLILDKNRDSLYEYARTCIDVIYKNYSFSQQDVTSISLIQGDALGGGLEAALATDVIIAEKSAKMGFPEILFNLFPGMGAYNFLSRKLSPREAEKIILSGKLYSAEEMYEMGIVDVLVEDGQGELAVYEHIKKENRMINGLRSFREAKQNINPVSYEELLNTVEIWVDAALRLEHRNLRMMERLVNKQGAKTSHAA